MSLGALVQAGHLKSKLAHLNDLRKYAKEDYRDAASIGVSDEELRKLEQEVRKLDDECVSIKKRLMLVKLKYGLKHD